jgi:hypothetical protein
MLGRLFLTPHRSLVAQEDDHPCHVTKQAPVQTNALWGPVPARSQHTSGLLGSRRARAVCAMLPLITGSPEQIRHKCESSNLLCANLRHPSTRAKKYDDGNDIWQGRVNRDCRPNFQIVGDTGKVKWTPSVGPAPCVR